MRRLVPAGLVLGVIAALAFAVGASSEPVDGVRVPSVEAFNALDARVSELEDRVTALEPTPTPTETPTSEPTPTETATPTPTVEPIVWPTPETTGPRSEPTTVLAGGLSSSEPGQVIEGVVVNGRLTIRHDDVTVRDVRINGTGTYMLYVRSKDDGTCPTGVRIEHTEIDGAAATEADIPIFMQCGAVFDDGYVHNVGRSSRLVNNGTVSNSYIIADRAGDSGSHRGAVGTNGGDNNAIVGNVLLCASSRGCSAAIPMYGDFNPVTNMLVKGNLLATTGGYCAYGGSLSSKPYPEASNVDFIDNHFSTRYEANCGQFGPITSHATGVRDNDWAGNVWHETGEPINR